MNNNRADTTSSRTPGLGDSCGKTGRFGGVLALLPLEASPAMAEVPNTLLDRIVRGVLYAGHDVFPCRTSDRQQLGEGSAVGLVYPQTHCEQQHGLEVCLKQVECLLRVNWEFPRLEITAGFLQASERQVGRVIVLPEGSRSAVPEFEKVEELDVDGTIYRTQAEAVERKVTFDVDSFPFKRAIPFLFPATETSHALVDDAGEMQGAIQRRGAALQGTVWAEGRQIEKNLYKITVRVINHSAMSAEELENQAQVLRRCFMSTHVTLQVSGGAFVSLFDPPEALKARNGECENIGLWPVLVGDEARPANDTVLASPVLLYDYPKCVPPSPDGSREIGETPGSDAPLMPENEERQAQADAFARSLFGHKQGLGAEDFLKLHGVVRKLHGPPGSDSSAERPPSLCYRTVESVKVEGVELHKGDRVVVCPKRRADVMDLMLAGKTALIEGLEEDAEHNIHLALILAGDAAPAMDANAHPSHRFVYNADEVRPVRAEAAS